MTEDKNGKIKVDLHNGQSGEISTIRDILMGSQLGAYEQRFQEIERRLDNLEQLMSKSTESTTTNIQQLQTTLKSDFVTRIESLESKIDDSKTKDREELSKIFSELSSRLLK